MHIHTVFISDLWTITTVLRTWFTSLWAMHVSWLTSIFFRHLCCHPSRASYPVSLRVRRFGARHYCTVYVHMARFYSIYLGMPHCRTLLGCLECLWIFSHFDCKYMHRFESHNGLLNRTMDYWIAQWIIESHDALLIHTIDYWIAWWIIVSHNGLVNRTMD